MNRHSIASASAHSALVVSLLAVCGMPACRTTAPTDAPAKPAATPAPAPIEGAEWRCTVLNGTPVADEHPPTITFDADGKVHGFAGINRYFGTCTRTGTSVKFDRMVATKMGGPPERMAFEQRFLDGLMKADSMSADAHSLRVSTGGKTVLEFAR